MTDFFMFCAGAGSVSEILVDPNETKFSEGENVVLECNAFGHPRPAVLWAKQADFETEKGAFFTEFSTRYALLPFPPIFLYSYCSCPFRAPNFLLIAVSRPYALLFPNTRVLSYRSVRSF